MPLLGERLLETPRLNVAPAAPDEWKHISGKLTGTHPGVAIALCGGIIFFGLFIFHSLRNVSPPSTLSSASVNSPTPSRKARMRYETESAYCRL